MKILSRFLTGLTSSALVISHLTGCSGGGSGENSTLNQGKEKVSIKGVAQAGPINGSVNIYEMGPNGERGKFLGAQNTDNGVFEIDIQKTENPVIIAASGTYQDEATGLQVDMQGHELTQILPNATENTEAPVTPATTFVADMVQEKIRKGELLRLDAKGAIKEASQKVAQLFGVDPNTIKAVPKPPTQMDSQSNEGKAALLLTAISQAMKDGELTSDKGVNPIEAIKKLSSALAQKREENKKISGVDFQTDPKLENFGSNWATKLKVARDKVAGDNGITLPNDWVLPKADIGKNSLNLRPIARPDSIKIVAQTPDKGLTASDPNGDVLNFIVVRQASKGVIDFPNPNHGTFKYTPSTAQFGSDSFTFKVSDGLLESEVVTVQLNRVPRDGFHAGDCYINGLIAFPLLAGTGFCPGDETFYDRGKPATGIFGVNRSNGKPSATLEPTLHAIGVYEPSNKSFWQSPSGIINVNITGTGSVALGLASYESVNWVINAGAGIEVKTVALSSYYQSSITNTPSANLSVSCYQKTKYISPGSFNPEYCANQDYSYFYEHPTKGSQAYIQNLETKTGLTVSSIFANYSAETIDIITSPQERFFSNGRPGYGWFGNLLYQNGYPLSGSDGGKLYRGGTLFTGVSEGKYYKNGVLGTGLFENKYYSGGSLGSGYYLNVYYSDGTPANGLFEGKYFKNGALGTGVFNNKYYAGGVLGTGWEENFFGQDKYFINGNLVDPKLSDSYSPGANYNQVPTLGRGFDGAQYTTRQETDYCYKVDRNQSQILPCKQEVRFFLGGRFITGLGRHPSSLEIFRLNGEVVTPPNHGFSKITCAPINSTTFSCLLSKHLSSQTITVNYTDTSLNLKPAQLSIVEGATIPLGTSKLGDVAEKTLTLINQGDRELNKLSSSVSDKVHFDFKNGFYPGASGTCSDRLSPKATCTIIISFKPLCSGAMNTKISFDYQDAVSGTSGFTYTLNLTGTGTSTNQLDSCSEKWIGLRRIGISGVQLWTKSLDIDSQGSVYIRGESYLDMNRRSTFLMKFSKTGERIYPTTLEKPDFSSRSIPWAGSSLIDQDGNLLLAHFTYDAQRGRETMNLTKLKSIDLSILWTVSFEGGPYPVSLATDGSGNILILGRSYFSQSEDSYLIKLNSVGTLIWQKTLPSFEASVVKADSSGTIYVGGKSKNTSGSKTVTLAKYDSDGNSNWLFRGDYNGVESTISSLTFDPMGSLLISGNSGSAYFLTKLLPSGEEAWTASSSASSSIVKKIATTTDGNIYVVGTTRGGPLDGQTLKNYNTDALFLTRYSSSGTRLWTKLLQARDGDPSREYGHTSGTDLAIDKAGNAVVLGQVSNPVALERIPAIGEMDAFIVKFNANGERQ